MPAENLLTPDTVRRLMWTPPEPEPEAVAEALREYAARPWQIELTTAVLADAIAAAQPDG